jgi:metallo-beta-lactamase class B
MNKYVVLAVLAALPIGVSAPAQEVGPRGKGAANYPAPTAFPNENKAQVALHLSRARRIAGADLFPDMVHRCIFSPVHPVRTRNLQFDGKIVPTRIFDNLYSIGQNAVSSQALKTSDGLIIFDSLNNEDEAKNLLVPNLVALGLDPRTIKYLVITHGHGDHYGGARYLQQTYGARVVASAADWAMMERGDASGPFARLKAPKRDIVMPDGGTLKLGQTIVKFYVTPGHTPGVLSSIFTVTDRGVPHVAGYFGGTGGGGNAGPEATRQHIASLTRWAALTRKAGVDVNITNHPLHSEALEKEELVRYRIPGDPNPFVLGRATYQRYIQVQQECGRVQLARAGLSE